MGDGGLRGKGRGVMLLSLQRRRGQIGRGNGQQHEGKRK